MKINRNMSQRINISERFKIIENVSLSIAEVTDTLLKRANEENLSDRKVIHLLEYLLSFEAFLELEFYFFYFYDPKNLEVWNGIINHVYYRSITENYLMN